MYLYWLLPILKLAINADGLAMPDIYPMTANDLKMAGSDQPDVNGLLFFALLAGCFVLKDLFGGVVTIS